jgi:hypothetical protein
VAALVAALVVLVGSMAAAAAYATSTDSWPWSQRAQSGTSWQGGWGMMDRDQGDDEGYGGMMSRGPSGFEGDGAAISLAEATKLADDWLAKNQPGMTAGPGVQMPMGYAFPLTRDSRTVGTLMVDDDSGQIVLRRWSDVTPNGDGT